MCLEVGDEVDFHSVIGEGITSKGHQIYAMGRVCGGEVAWLTNKAGCVALEALSLSEESAL